MVIAECFWVKKNLEISFILSCAFGIILKRTDEHGTHFYLIGQSHKKSHAIIAPGLLPEFETITVLRVVFSSEQRLNQPAINAVQ